MQPTTREFTPEVFQGNWQHRSCFIWDGPDDAEQFGLWMLSHRDSALIDQSNGAVIRKRLAQFEASGDVMFFDCHHWAVGTTHEMALRVHRQGTTETTDAFNELARIVEALEQYPILDEADYADREYVSALEGIDLMAIGAVDLPAAVRDDWKEQVHEWLSENEPRELENKDDYGACPATEAVLRALLALEIIAPSDLM